MATTLQIRRGNTDDNNRFKGASGEITLDTDLWQLRAHDNVTVGGHVIAGGGSNTPAVTIPTINITNTTGITYTRSVLGNDITYTTGGLLSTGYGGTGSTSPLMTSTSPLAITGTWPNVNIAISGNVSVDHGGTGLTTTPGQNQVLLGDGSKYNLTTLVPGSGITFDQTQAGILTIRGGGGSGNSITLADLPPGAIQYFAMQAPPDGWLECNGATLSRTAYNNLYQPLWQNIGYQYGGSGDNFNLPDLRGEFIRGWDHGRGLDASRAFGTTQTDELKSHTHQVSLPNQLKKTPNVPNLPNSEGVSGVEVLTTNLSFQTSTTGGTETRPHNIALLPCIKFKPGTAQPLLSSVDVSGGTTGLVFSGGPITSTGTITASGTLAVANGGTGVSGPNPAFHLERVVANYVLSVTGTTRTASYPVIWNTQITKQSIDYNTTTGYITISTAGIYHLYSNIQYAELSGVYFTGVVIVKGTSQVVAETYLAGTLGASTVSCCVTILCAVGDTFHVNAAYSVSSMAEVQQESDGSGKIQFVIPHRNYFGGYRVG